MDVSVLDKFVVAITDNDLVSQDNQHRLIFWLDTFRNGQFDIGDVAVEEIERNAAMGLRVPQARIFKAVGRFCGKSARTVRYYYETALFYPRSVREEFNMLPFSHFVFARYLGDQWRECLEWAAIHPGSTEERLRREFYPLSGGCLNSGDEVSGMDLEDEPLEALKRPAAMDEKNNTTAAVESCEVSQNKTAGDAGSAARSRWDRHAVVSVIDKLLVMLDHVLDISLSARVSVEAREEIRDAITALRNRLPEVVKSVV